MYKNKATILPYTHSTYCITLEMYVQAEKEAHSNLIEIICEELKLSTANARRFMQYFPGHWAYVYYNICAANRVTVHVGEAGDDLRKDSDPGFYAGTILSGNNDTGKYQVKFDDEERSRSINLIEGTGLAGLRIGLDRFNRVSGILGLGLWFRVMV